MAPHAANIASYCRRSTRKLAFVFIVTNFGVWALGSLYPKTMEGLITCYLAAVPFFRNTLIGDAFYTAVLFGGFALAERRFSVLGGTNAAVQRDR